MFSGKESWPKMIWNWDLSLLEKFVVNVQYEIGNHQKTYGTGGSRSRSRIWRWSLTYLINSKEAWGRACEIWLKLRLLKNMATFQTLRTWIGHNATRYQNLNALPHPLPHALPYIFSEICLVLRCLQWATTRYRQYF